MKNKLQSKIKQDIFRYFVVITLACLLFSMPLSVYATGNKVALTAEQLVQKKLITLNFNNVGIRKILEEIKKQSGIGFALNDTKIEQNLKLLSINVKNVTVDNALTILLKNTNYKYVIVENNIVIKPIVKLGAEIYVKGKVVDDNNKPIAGATIIVEGTSNGAITDDKGAFAIRAKENNVLEISYVGFKKQNYSVTKLNNDLFIRLKPDVVAVDEVVVIGYGERKKKELISAVSTITADDIKESTASSVVGLLQGRVAGLEVNQQSGGPGGGGNKVAIRGYTTIGGSSHDGTPLYVVDGIPINSNVSDISGTDPLALIDPATIQSVEVLKDAASAAIYGSRAANGVILITTKKGKKGQSEFSAQAVYAVSVLPTSPIQSGGNLERIYGISLMQSHLRAGSDTAGGMWDEILYNRRYPNSYEDAFNGTGEYDMFWNGGYGSDKPALQDSLNRFYNNSTNWFKETFRIGRVLDAKVQAQGGSDKVQYMISGGYFNETGIMFSSKYSRMSLSSNIQAQPTKRINLSSQIALGYSDRSTGLQSGPFSPNVGVEGFTCDPKQTSTLLPSDGVTKKELFEKLNSTVQKMDDYNLRAALQVKLNIIDGLDLSSAAGVNFNQSNSNVFQPKELDLVYKEALSVGRVKRGIQIQNENLLTYKKTFASSHNIDFLLGLSLSKNQSHLIEGSGRGNPSDRIYYYENNGATIIQEGSSTRNLLSYHSSFDESSMVSYFGRIAYNYKQKYLMEFTVRRDGSSMFGENNKYATFPSIAVGWNIKDENFMKSFWWIDIAKIRVSWGTSGQIFKKPYIAHGALEQTETIDGRPGLRPSGNLINKSLTWEESDQYDIGFDFSLLNHRINAKIDYYYKYTTGLLTDVELPGDFYFSEKQDKNAGEVSNKGIEFEFDIDILRDGPVKWNMGFNISRNWNKFIKSYVKTDLFDKVIGRPLFVMNAYQDSGLYQYDTDVPLNYTQEGYPSYLSYMPSSKEFYNAGQRNIKDVDGDGYINQNDMVYVGTPLPKAYGGWTNKLGWKNLSLDIHFSYSLGRKIIPLYMTHSLKTPMGPYFSDLNNVSFWEKPGDSGVLPAKHNFMDIVNYGEQVASDIQNVNYIKLKQLTLGYNLPKKVMQKIGLSDIRVYFTAENLFTLTNYKGMDPEIVSIMTGVDVLNAYPLSRKFSFGINVKF